MIDEALKQLNKISYEEELAKLGETPETLLEMALVGVVDNTIYIKIYGGEGHVPHFHFYETQSCRKGCIKILEASYFAHGNYLDDLKRDERKELVKWLTEMDEESVEQGIPRTNWQAICLEWNKNNPQYRLKNLNPPIPDYMKL